MRSGGIVINLSRKFQALCGYGAEPMVTALDVDASTSDLSDATLDVSVSYKECTQVEQDLVSSVSQALDKIAATDNKTLAETFYPNIETNAFLSSPNSPDINSTSSSPFIIATLSSNTPLNNHQHK
jgi:hypothetical protein